MKMSNLKNGTKEAEPLVLTLMVNLRKLMSDKPMVLYDLVEKCRDSSYKMFGNAAAELQDLALMNPDESIHGSIKNIVLSAVEGEGLEMTIGSPIKT